MNTITVAILGLSRLGLSVGLALKRYNAGKGARHQFQVVGADTRPVPAGLEKRGAVDSVARSLYGAAQNRDIVVLALPYADVRAAYADIGPGLRAGAVVLDLSPLKRPSLEWAAASLPETAYMVGVTPILNPDALFGGLDDADHARADLFDKGAWLLAPAPRCPSDAVELASDFSRVMGAEPHFMDADEHDSLAAATVGLPALLGLAAFRMMRERKAWDDARRLTNADFGRLTHHLADTHPDDLRDLLLLNRQHTAQYLDSLIGTLQSLRGVLERDDRAALEAALIDAVGAYGEWLARRRTGRWDEERQTPRGGGVASGLMGDYLARKLRGEGDKGER